MEFYHIMLRKKANYIPEARGYAIGCKSKKYRAAGGRTTNWIERGCFIGNLMLVLSFIRREVILRFIFIKSSKWLKRKIVLCG